MTDARALARSAVSRALSVVRRGPRTVLWTPTIRMGVGNQLYLWLWAHNRRLEGHDDAVLWRPAMATWLSELPAMDELVVRPSDVKFTDRRDVFWNQTFGQDFTREQLQRFITERVLTAPAFGRTPTSDPDTVLINVRRGEYYSEAKFRGQYGFDVDAYLKVAVAAALDTGTIPRIHVVSDGIDWCKARLGWLGDIAPQVTFLAEGTPPMEQFVTVSTARRLILANSTFSYWAGYTSSVLHGADGFVWAPWFHARHFGDGRAFQLDPAWRVIEHIPGGWDS